MSQQLENKDSRQDDKDEEQDEIHLLDLLIVLARHKKLVIGMPFVIGTLALIASLQMTPIFTSTAKIMPPQQQSSGMAAMLGQLGGLAGAAGGIAGIKNPNDLYVGILESRTVADNLISRFKLQERYESKTMDGARAALAGASQIANGKKDGLISISVSDADPKFAADLANAFVNELTKLTQTMAISEASQRRLFFEQQLKETKDQLANAEIALRTTQERTGMIQPEGQVQSIIASVAQLKGTIAAKEVQLNAMRTFATTQNPELLRTQEELRGLQAQLLKLEKNRPSKDGDSTLSTGRIPEAGIEYVRSLRNVKYYETIFELLAKQYELAKIDEAKDSSMIQLLDKAVPAERKSKPKRAVITLVGLLSGGMLGVLLAFVFELYRRSRQNTESSSRWQELSAAWRGHEGKSAS
jgi:tyrosine-protein kinase Etk/Wzc